jgi:hypothetical protein
VIQGFCDAATGTDLMMRSNLFDAITKGKDCQQTLNDLKYQGSVAQKYDPLTTELSNEGICEAFTNEISTLNQIGNNSTQDALRFSYEVSFTGDTDA